MREYIQRALEVINGNGARYGDIRIEENRKETIATKNGRVEVINRANDCGFGIRVIAGGGWGFAASPDLSLTEVERIALLAVRVARASGILQRQRIELAPAPRLTAGWQSRVQIDPFKVSLNDKITLLLECDRLMRQVKGISLTDTRLASYCVHKWYADTEGALLDQIITQVGVGIEAGAITEDEVQSRSYPSSFGGQFGSAGYELILSLNLAENATRIAEEAVALLSAKPCPTETTTLILHSDQLALQIHESCGHPIELDRVLGCEISDYGTSFLTLEKLGNYRYGSDLVNIVADPTYEGGLGSFAFDDEGVPASRSTIVENGIFKGYLTSRETAAQTGLTPNASMRADSWRNTPLIRMTNVSLLPGDSNLERMIAETDDGVYMLTNKSWSIDEQRLNFQFGAELAYEIKSGKLGSLIKNASYGGVTPEFWRSCDAVAGQEEWTMWGIPGCGKGEPDQTARVGHGAAPARFRNVKIGVTR